jgi:hypothetical protein
MNIRCSSRGVSASGYPVGARAPAAAVFVFLLLRRAAGETVVHQRAQPRIRTRGGGVHSSTGGTLH